MKITRFTGFILLLAVLILIPFNVYSAVPQTIAYQGYLTDPAGVPMDGTVQMNISIYDVSSGGTALWTETHASVAVDQGVFSIVIGSVDPGGNPLDEPFDTQYWLGIQVETDDEMTPRQELTSVPYALRADESDYASDADRLDGLDSTELALDTEIMPSVLANDGSGSGLDADRLDGLDSTELALNTEIMPTVLANDGSGSTLDADTLDGTDSTGFAVLSHSHASSSYGNVAIVAQSGGDYTSPLVAMNNVSTGDAWCGAPSSLNPCLVRIMPGKYDLGNNVLAMQSYVDIEGSGENVTIITSTNSSETTDGNSATVQGASNAEIRFLTVDNQGGGSFSFGIINLGVSPQITNVTVSASGGSSRNCGVRNDDSSPSMTNVTASASGGINSCGVQNIDSSSPSMTNVTASASGGSNSYGVYNSSSSSPSMTNVTASASGGSNGNYGVYNSSFSFFPMVPVMVDVSSNGIVITGNVLFVPANSTDVDDPSDGNADENGELLLSVSNVIAGLGASNSTNRYTIKLDAGTYALGNNGLAMQEYVDIEGSGENTTIITSSHSSGTFDENSATVKGASNAEIRFLTVENTGGDRYSFGILNFGASPKIVNVTLSTSGGTYNYGVANYDDSSPSMTNVTASASGGSDNFGVYNSSSSPSMTNVTASASGGSFGYGVHNSSSSSPSMTNVTASASGGSIANYGVYNSSSSSPSMTNVTASASGGSNANYGVRNYESSPSMTNVTASAFGGSTSYGVSNSPFSYPVIVDVSSNGIVITGNQLFVPASGSATDNGTLLLLVSNVIAGLGAPDLPDPDKRYTIKLDAGTYDLVNNGFAMQEYVDVEGSGENTTIITSSHSSGTFDENSATVKGASNAEIRFLTVKNRGGSTISFAVYNGSASPDMTNVTATAYGANDYNCGVYNISSSSPAMTNVTARGIGGQRARCVGNDSSSPSMTNTTGIAEDGSSSNICVYNTNSSAVIRGSSFTGATNSIRNQSSTVNVAATMLEGTVTGTGFACVGAYDETFTALDTSCN